MSSHLRLQSSFDPLPAKASYQTSTILPPTKKQKMSLTQTYFVASTARSKLGREAARGDHNLRRLVGHANLLDTLMVELADAEREQEAWFNQSVQKASKPQQSRHIQWIDSITEESIQDDGEEATSDNESDSGSECDEDEISIFTMPVRKLISAPVHISSTGGHMEDDDDDDDNEEIEDDDDDDEFDAEHTLTRVATNIPPPELTHDADSDSEDESMPSSPEQSTFELTDKQHQAISTSTLFSPQPQSGLQDYIMQRTPSQPRLIAAC